MDVLPESLFDADIWKKVKLLQITFNIFFEAIHRPTNHTEDQGFFAFFSRCISSTVQLLNKYNIEEMFVYANDSGY